MMPVSFPVLISHLLFCAGLCTSNIKFRFQIGLCPLLCQSSCVYNCRFNDRFDDRRIRLNLLTNLINRYAQNDCYYNSLNCSQTYTDCNCCRGRKITICVAITNWRIFAIRKQIALKQTVLLMECAIGIEKPSDLWIIIATTKMVC